MLWLKTSHVAGTETVNVKRYIYYAVDKKIPLREGQELLAGHFTLPVVNTGYWITRVRLITSQVF